MKTLIGRLSHTSRIAATHAAAICVGPVQYEVDLEHMFLALLEQPGSDFAVLTHQFSISVDMLAADLQAEVR